LKISLHSFWFIHRIQSKLHYGPQSESQSIGRKKHHDFKNCFCQNNHSEEHWLPTVF